MKKDNVIKTSAVIEVNEKNFDLEVLKEVDKLVLVDFYATWCGPCKQLSPILDKISLKQKNIKVVKVNSDKNLMLTQKQQVQSLPTVKFFKNGALVSDFFGFKTEKDILKIITSLC